jgi:hypothetical protein
MFSEPPESRKAIDRHLARVVMLHVNDDAGAAGRKDGRLPFDFGNANNRSGGGVFAGSSAPTSHFTWCA